MLEILKKLKFILKWKYAFLAFALPVIAVCAGFARAEAAPFGENSFLNMDLWGQYFPIYMDQNNHRLDMSPFYSWNGALGFNAFAQSGYYGNSVFLLLFMLFKTSSMIMALQIILISKFGLASLGCFFFLKQKFKREDMLTAGFSVAYSLCAYMMAFITQPMWTDAVILLPIVLIGLERMLTDKKPLFYCLSLAFLIFTNFYIGFSVCIFLSLYFLVFAVGNPDKFSFGAFLRQAKYFAGFSVLAAGLAAFSLLPVYDAINLTLASDITSPDAGRLYHPIRDYFSNMLPYSSVSLEYGAPNIYSGSFAFLLLPLFVLNDMIKLRKRVMYTALIVFLYFSFNFNLFDYIWHGFHFPNQLPGRWSFIFTLAVIIVCCESLAKPNEWRYWKSKMIAAAPYALLAVYIGGEVEKKHESPAAFAAAAAVLILAVLIVSANSRKYKIIQNIAWAAIGTVIIFEAAVSAAAVIPRDTKITAVKDYQFADDKMKSIVSKYDGGGDDFYRIEMSPRFTFNPGMLYNYKGISYYSSTMTGAAYDFFDTMGYHVYAKNVSALYNPYYPALNSMLNIKYLIQRSGNEKIFGFEQIDIYEDFKILQNKYYLPVAFTASGAMADWNPDQTINMIQNQNAFMRAAVYDCPDIYIRLPEGGMIVTNADLTRSGDWNEQYYYRQNNDERVVFEFNYKTESAASIFLVHGFRAGELSVSIDNGEAVKYNYSSPTIDLGFVKEGTTISVIVSIENIFIGVWGMDLFMLDEAAFDYCYEYLSKDTLEVINAGDTKIKCRINSPSGGLLYTSIPAVGWSLKCDGVKTETFTIGGFLLAANIPAGDSILEFNYIVPGLIPGIVISLASLAVLILCLLLINKKIKKG